MKKGFIFVIILVKALMVLIAGCAHSSTWHNSLEEMQAAMWDNVYYFRFEGVDFSEVGEFRTFRTHSGSTRDGERWAFRYSIRGFEVVNAEGKVFPFEVVASYHRFPMVITAVRFTRKIIDEQYIGFSHDERNRKLTATVGLVRDDTDEPLYWYYFIMRDVQRELCQYEVEFFVLVVEHAILNRYKVN